MEEKDDNDRKRKSNCLQNNDDDDDCIVIDAPTRGIATITSSSSSDDDCVVIDAPLQVIATITSSSSSSSQTVPADDSKELEIVGTTGQNALEDFPHARQDCVKFPMNKSTAIFSCNNCYCYVCDVKASECPSWLNSHCRAKKGDFFFENMRRQARRNRKQLEKSSTNPLLRAPIMRQLLQASSQAQLPRRMPRVSVPRRMPRAYIHDWQQVARTQANIVNEEVVEEINPTEPGDSSISVRALLSRVTNKKDSTNEMSPPSHIFTTNLRSYQKQSLAFMISKETSANPSGWLASDVGMGKSAIVLALIASDSHSTSIGNFSNKLKATVVLTSVSLMGQWEDEAKKHAPGLVVRRFHPNSRSSVGLDLRDFYNPSIISALRGADLIITTASFQWPEKLTSLYEFHRIVMDESHLLSNSRSANVTWASQLRARRKWCVSATPCTASIVNLKSQMTFLGISNGSLFDCAFRKLENNRNTSSGQSTAAFQEFAEIFSTYVTRHDKTQLAGDGNALPSKTSKVVTLKMSFQEKVRYRNALGQVNQRLIQQYERDGAATFTLETNLLHKTSSDKLFSEWTESSKISALLQEMKSLQERDYNLRAVVFTQFSKTHKQVVKALHRFFQIRVVYEITGSTSSTDRDFAIRVFQGPRNFPAVIVIMLRSGMTGITLTQADHLFLMEPCLDPAAEIQALGRIHRLGQDRNCELKKFVFEDSVESNIVELHKKIEAGQIEMQNNFVPNDAVKVLTRNWNGVDKALLPSNHTKKLVETIKQLTRLWATEEQLMGNHVFYWNILSADVIKTIAASVPMTVEELGALGALGEQKLEEYGSRLVNTIKKFVADEGLEGHFLKE